MTIVVGVRDFKDRVSSYVEQAEAGEVITVTRRGKAVARVIPAGITPAIARLIAEGQITWSGGKPDFGRPIKLKGTGKLASDFVIEGRR